VYHKRCFVYGVTYMVFHVRCYMYGVCVSCFVYSVPCTMFRVWCFYLVPCTLYLVPCTLYLVPCTLYLVPCTLYQVPYTRYRLPCTVNKVLNLSLQVSASLERYSFSNILACIGINASHLYITLQYSLLNLRNDRGRLPK